MQVGRVDNQYGIYHNWEWKTNLNQALLEIVYVKWFALCLKMYKRNSSHTLQLYTDSLFKSRFEPFSAAACYSEWMSWLKRPASEKLISFVYETSWHHVHWKPHLSSLNDSQFWIEHFQRCRAPKLKNRDLSRLRRTWPFRGLIRLINYLSVKWLCLICHCNYEGVIKESYNKSLFP